MSNNYITIAQLQLCFTIQINLFGTHNEITDNITLITILEHVFTTLALLILTESETDTFFIIIRCYKAACFKSIYCVKHYLNKHDVTGVQS